MVRALPASEANDDRRHCQRHCKSVRVRAIRCWLYAVAALVLAMVLVGGATRLTESGLSIVEWKPVTGALPPLSAEAWQAEFEKYQAIPQYQRAQPRHEPRCSSRPSIWWEWTHRLLGRVIGVAFLLPFLWFLWRGWVEPGLRARLWFIFGLGALQGAVGWWMVASGLADRVEVSQYRLAFHLVLAVRDLCRDGLDRAGSVSAPARSPCRGACASAPSRSSCWCWCRSISARWSRACMPG